MGCDGGVLVSDKAFAGSDTWATSYVLAEAIKTLGDYQLIICGERATDGDTGQVGPGIAAWLDLPVATYVSKVESVSADACRCRRLVEEGYEVLDVATPALLTVVKEVANPRLPTLGGKQKARKLDVHTLGPADMTVKQEYLGLNGSPTRVVKIFRPKVARQCQMAAASDEKSIDQAADDLVDFLKQRKLI
jgi:electron transfer flavoprotein beta subunit